MDFYLISPLLLFLVLSVLGLAAVHLTGQHRETLRWQTQLFLVALVVRFAASLAIYEFGLIEVLLDEDGDGWVSGVSMKRLWEQQGVGILELPSVLTDAFRGGGHGYKYLVGALLLVWDLGQENRLDVALLNCFFGAATIIALYRTAATAFSPRVARLAAWWGALFPSLIVWSAQTLKEPVIIFLESVALYACVRMTVTGPTFRHLVLSGVAIGLLAPFRFYAVFLMAAVLAGTALLAMFRGRTLASPLVGLAAVVIGVAILSVIQAQNEREVQGFGLQYIAGFRANVAEGSGSGVTLDLDLDTPLGLGIGTVVGGLHLLFAPFPWQWLDGSARLLSTIPELLVWWWLFAAGVLTGLRRAVRERFSHVQPILLYLAGFGLLYSLMFGNVGLAYRQRAQLLPWLLIFAAAGLEERWARRRQVGGAMASAHAGNGRVTHTSRA